VESEQISDIDGQEALASTSYDLGGGLEVDAVHGDGHEPVSDADPAEKIGPTGRHLPGQED
jgi:hypothetical protein